MSGAASRAATFSHEEIEQKVLCLLKPKIEGYGSVVLRNGKVPGLFCFPIIWRTGGQYLILRIDLPTTRSVELTVKYNGSRTLWVNGKAARRPIEEVRPVSPFRVQATKPSVAHCQFCIRMEHFKAEELGCGCLDTKTRIDCIGGF